MIGDTQDNISSEVPTGELHPEPINQWGGKLSLFFAILHFSHDLNAGLLVALLAFIRQDLGLNYLQSAFLVSSYQLTSGLAQILGGWLSDRISKRLAITLGLVGVSFAAIAIGFVPSYYAMVGLLIAKGIFAGFFHPSAVSTLTNYFPQQQRGRVMALHSFGGTLGFGLCPLLGVLIARSLGWRFAFIILSVPSLLAAPFIFPQLKLPAVMKKPTREVSSPAAGMKRIGVWQVFRPVLSVIIIAVAMQLLTGPIMSFAALFLIDVHHLSLETGSMWVTIIRMSGLGGSLFGGWLSDKWGRRKTIFLILVSFGPIVFLLTKLPYGFALGAMFVLFGMLMMMRETTMQAFMMDNSPPNLRATVMGVYFGFGQQGSSIIQPIAGSFMDKIGIAGVYNVIAPISVFLSVLAGILALRNAHSPKTAQKAVPQ